MSNTNIYVDLATDPLPVRDLLSRVMELKIEHPDEDITYDGDSHAIIGRPRA